MIKDATVKVFHYDDLESLKAHVMAIVAATISPSTSRLCNGERHTKPSATHRPKTRHSLRSTRTSSFRTTQLASFG